MSTITVNGRTRYADGALTTITISSRQHGEPLLTLHGGLLECSSALSRAGTDRITVMHPTGVDEDHDAAYLAIFEGSPFELSLVNPNGIVGTMVIYSAQHYDGLEPHPLDEDYKCTYEECEQAPHVYYPYQPPKKPWKAGLYWVTITFHSPREAEKVPN